MDIYAEEVMDHYENPRNQGELVGDPSAHSVSSGQAGSGQVLSARDANASCGDMIQMFFRVEGGQIAEVKWKGIGCAISTAAASKLSEQLQGVSLQALEVMSEEELLKKIGFEVNPGRMKCLTLPVRVVKKLFPEHN